MNENDVEVKKDVDNEEIRSRCLELKKEYDRLTKAEEEKRFFDVDFFNVIDLWVNIIFYSLLISSGLAAIAIFVSFIFCIFNGESVL